MRGLREIIHTLSKIRSTHLYIMFESSELFRWTRLLIQYILNLNRCVPIQKISVPITEFVRIGEVALILWRINNTKICDNPLSLVYSFNSLLNTLTYEGNDTNYLPNRCK